MFLHQPERPHHGACRGPEWTLEVNAANAGTGESISGLSSAAGVPLGIGAEASDSTAAMKMVLTKLGFA